MKVEAGEALAAGRSHIIERPRLTRLLDEATARIILLVAPAGYGKTTLAREWLVGRRHGWYRGNASTGDLAALALGLARAAAKVVQGVDRRLAAHLRVSSPPTNDVEGLAELVADDLAQWPSDAWLVFDDYQFACDSQIAERFVEHLVWLSPLRLLIASRSRPTWATARRLLYGEIYEVGRSVLAMSHEEAESVLLVAKAPKEIDGLTTLADGWPALLGVAAMTAEELKIPSGHLPEELYGFFAEELYGELAPSAQQGLRRLSLTSELTPEVARLVLGSDASSILNEAAQSGFFLMTSSERLEFHPLLRSFLQSKFSRRHDDCDGQLVPALIRRLIAQEEWDEAFALIERFFDADLLVELFNAALLRFVDQARLPTLQSWIEFANQHRLDSAIVDLADAEVSFKQGDLRHAEALGLQAVQQMGPGDLFGSRALWIAGMSAHLATREQEAWDHFKAAALLASCDADARQALWGQFAAAYKLDHVDEASALLDEVERTAGGTADERLRITTGRLMLSSLTGGLSSCLRDAELILPLASRSRDPLIHSSFLNVHSAVLNLAGRYEDARQSALLELDVAMKYGLGFVLPNARFHLGGSLWGLRDFRRCAEVLRASEKACVSNADHFLLVNIGIVFARIHLATGAVTDALDVLDHYHRHSSIQSMHAEYLAWWSLAHAVAGQTFEATAFGEQASAMSSRIEVAALLPWARAVVAIKTGRSSRRLAEEALSIAFRTGNIDAFVAAYRACPELLELLVSSGEKRDQLGTLLEHAHDHRLAEKCGLKLGAEPLGKQIAPLTPRETEVIDLVSQGFTNKDIGRALFITEATVKVHVRKICQKLGVRSRTEAAMRASELSE